MPVSKIPFQSSDILQYFPLFDCHPIDNADEISVLNDYP